MGERGAGAGGAGARVDDRIYCAATRESSPDSFCVKRIVFWRIEFQGSTAGKGYSTRLTTSTSTRVLEYTGSLPTGFILYSSYAGDSAAERCLSCPDAHSFIYWFESYHYRHTHTKFQYLSQCQCHNPRMHLLLSLQACASFSFLTSKGWSVVQRLGQSGFGSIYSYSVY